jgi:hypothetical protein
VERDARAHLQAEDRARHLAIRQQEGGPAQRRWAPEILRRDELHGLRGKRNPGNSGPRGESGGRQEPRGFGWDAARMPRLLSSAGCSSSVVRVVSASRTPDSRFSRCSRRSSYGLKMTDGGSRSIVAQCVQVARDVAASDGPSASSALAAPARSTVAFVCIVRW